MKTMNWDRIEGNWNQATEWQNRQKDLVDQK
jgi:hypothetical protein